MQGGRSAADPASAPGRLASLDLLRGLVVLLMLFVNQVDSVDVASGFLRHAGEGADAVTLADLVLPAFLFMVGMSIPFALGGRLRREGLPSALRHVLARTAALLVLGVLMVNADLGRPVGPLTPGGWGLLAIAAALLVYRGEAGGIVQLRPHWWGILGMIGWAYLTAALAYLALRDRPWLLVVGVGLLNGLYYLDVLVEPAWLAALHPILGIGGLVGSQGAVALAGAALGVMAERHVRRRGSPWRMALEALALAVVLLAAALLLHRIDFGGHPAFDYNKELATPPWGLLSAAVTAVAWTAFFGAADGAGWRRWPPLLTIAGQNALLVYLLEPIVLTLLDASAAVFGRNPWGYLMEGGTASALLASVLFACVVAHLAGLLARAGVRPRL